MQRKRGGEISMAHLADEDRDSWGSSKVLPWMQLVKSEQSLQQGGDMSLVELG